jgi:hypothetical protein
MIGGKCLGPEERGPRFEGRKVRGSVLVDLIRTGDCTQA